MPTDTENSNVEQSEPAAPPRPYEKPAVERIPLSEAQAGVNPSVNIDLAQPLSS